MDELSTTSKNKACLLKNEEITEFIIDPSKYNLEKGNLADIQISTKKEAIDSFVKVLNNTSNKTMKEITILNAAGGLLVGGFSNKFEECVELAKQTVNNGKAFEKFERTSSGKTTQLTKPVKGQSSMFKAGLGIHF